jgi:F420-non-reducing hydrogenase small subunit
MADKPKVAFYWCASCGGCEEAVVDLEEKILAVVDAVDIILWPCAMDFKRSDIEAMPDKSIAVAFINGGVRMSEQEEWVHLLRKKSNVVVAFGSCAHLGGIPGLANLNTKAEVFQTVYRDVDSMDHASTVVPLTSTAYEGVTLHLPEFWDSVKALNQVTDVDYYLPGCAPPAALIWDAISAILAGTLPPKGAVLAPNKACCDDCPRKETKPDTLEITEIKRPATHIADPELCFLAQGFVCLGPATRSGCGNPCIEGNMPCRGCMGPMDDVFDQGAKFLSAFASVLAPKDEAAIDTLLDQIPDPVGTFYRFSLPTSLLHRRKVGAPV